jgi:excisionase family DNA binding protein
MPLDHGQQGFPEMLTAKELESLLKIDVKTIYSYVQRGLIPYVRIQSNLRFPKRRIMEWIDARSHLPR